MRDAFIADSEAEVREVAERYVMQYLNWSNWRGPKIYLNPDETLQPDLEAQLKKSLSYEFVKERSLLFGTPEYVADRIEELREELGLEQLLINSAWSGMPHESTMRSMRLFADKVLPRIRGAEPPAVRAAE